MLIRFLWFSLFHGIHSLHETPLRHSVCKAGRTARATIVLLRQTDSNFIFWQGLTKWPWNSGDIDLFEVSVYTGHVCHTEWTANSTGIFVVETGHVGKQTRQIPDVRNIFRTLSQNCEKRQQASPCLSFCPHGTTRIPLDGVSLSLMFVDFFESLSRKFKFH